MTTSAAAAFGTLLKIGDGGSPETFTTIAEVRTISGPELTRDTVDVTSHDSPANWEEVIATILRSGNVTFGINYLPTHATHDASTGLIKDMTDGTLRNFQLVMSDAANTTWSFAAYVVGFNPNFDHDAEINAEVTLKPSGQPTLA